MALSERIHPADIGEALPLGSNHLVLRDFGSKGAEIQPGKPEGSVHGDSTGVHSCDSTHDWRSIARAGNARIMHSSLILAGYQLARDRSYRGTEILARDPIDAGSAAELAAAIPQNKLFEKLGGAIQSKDQPMATAIVTRMVQLNTDPKKVKRVLRQFATTQDGALHAEKYYHTGCDDFESTRKSLKWTHLTVLARVTTSAYGFQAPGVEEATAFLGT